jgi:hypothetical protein
LQEHNKYMISHNADAIGDTKSVESTLSGLPAYRTEYESSLLGTPKIEIWTKHEEEGFTTENILKMTVTGRELTNMH